MSAQAGLQAGFGDPLGVDTLTQIRDRGFTIVRIDLQDVDQETTTALAQEVIDVGLQPLCIIRRPEQLHVLPEGSLAEAGNEPDLAKFGWTRASYLGFVDACIPLAIENDVRLYVGAVSNLNPRGFRFLDSMPWNGYPPDICCSIHRYPDGSLPTNPHRGSLSRDHEIERLKCIVGARPLACTEVGYHDGISGWNERDVASHMAWERTFFSGHGFELVVGFQINDGPDKLSRDPEYHYGFRRHPSLEWKPVADAFTKAV
jgi:hypothetical protein